MSIEEILEYAMVIGYLNNEGFQELLTKVDDGEYYRVILHERTASLVGAVLDGENEEVLEDLKKALEFFYLKFGCLGK